MQKIRVGLLIDDNAAPFWTYRMVESVIGSDFATIALVVRKKKVASKKSLAARLREGRTHIFYNLYRKLEYRFFRSSPDAFEPKDLTDLLKGIEVLEVECIEKKYSDYIKPADVSAIANYNLDLFLRLGFRILRGDILKAARLGIWSFHHGDNNLYRGGPPAFYEVFKRQKEVGSILQILTEDLDGGEVLYRSWSSVYRIQQDTLNGLYWKTSLFVERKLKELYELGEAGFLNKLQKENNALQFYSNKLHRLPDNYQFLKLFFIHFFNWFLHRLWKLFNIEQWILLYCFSDTNAPCTSIFRYKRLVPPKDRFWADPFVVFENNKHFIFFEEYFYKGNGKGHLSVMEIDRVKGRSRPEIILQQPYHLSYPFVFKYEGEYYMVPESEEASNIQLYKSVSFPYKWEFQMNLMENVKAVDTTIFVKDGKVWMFTNVVTIAGVPYSEELFLFYSDTLATTNWKPHPANPVISDVKSARSAGRIFSYKGKFYRPSQDCSFMYGYSTTMNEILVLNETEYKENKISDISPNWAHDVIATHAFSFDNQLSAIDAVVKRRKQLF